jgi:hydrogenase nickel incorporation protein HypA/HybF
VIADTALAGAKLHITDLPIVIYCSKCESLQELPDVQAFRCPQCQTPSADIRQGRELDIESIEIVDKESST